MRGISWYATALTSLTLVLCNSSSAQTVVINYVDRGWYSETGFHIPSNLNYNAGDTSFSGAYKELRNFFVFDLSGVTQPIASAKLALSVPGYPYAGYSSRDPSEDFELHDVVTPIADLLDGTGGVDAHTDLGSGVVYGSRTMSAADNGSVVEITLNSSAIVAMNSTHGLLGIGGSITTLDDLRNDEFTFAFTGDTDIVQLRLTVVPEPTVFFLVTIGAIILLGCRIPRSHG